MYVTESNINTGGSPTSTIELPFEATRRRAKPGSTLDDKYVGIRVTF